MAGAAFAERELRGGAVGEGMVEHVERVRAARFDLEGVSALPVATRVA